MVWLNNPVCLRCRVGGGDILHLVTDRVIHRLRGCPGKGTDIDVHKHSRDYCHSHWRTRSCIDILHEGRIAKTTSIIGQQL